MGHAQVCVSHSHRRRHHHGDRRGRHWVVVSTTLSDQKITVADDANCAAGDDVNGPISAYCQADIIDQHTLDITGGLTYAELDREDPNRATAMDSAFLQASLFTSVVAFGVAGMALVVGIVLTLIGSGAARARYLTRPQLRCRASCSPDPSRAGHVTFIGPTASGRRVVVPLLDSKPSRRAVRDLPMAVFVVDGQYGVGVADLVCRASVKGRFGFVRRIHPEFHARRVVV